MSQKIDPDTTAVMYRPVLIRAGIALIFGIATFFIQEPTDAVVNYGTAIFFLFSGSAMWEYLRRDPVPVGMRSPLSLIAAVWMLAALTLVGVQLGGLSATVTWITIAAALGLLAMVGVGATIFFAMQPLQPRVIYGDAHVGHKLTGAKSGTVQVGDCDTKTIPVTVTVTGSGVLDLVNAETSS